MAAETRVQDIGKGMRGIQPEHRQYGGLRAKGHAFTHQGDFNQGNFYQVNNYCTAPRDHPEEVEPRKVARSRTCEDTDRVCQVREPQPPRAHSIDHLCPVLRNLAETTKRTPHHVRGTKNITACDRCTEQMSCPVAEPSPASATSGFIGLHDVDDSAASSSSWKADFLKEAISVDVVIADAGKGGLSCRRSWSCGAKVSLETQDVPNSHRNRQLRITEKKSSVLWLPETRVRVQSRGESVIVRFSNCNKLQPPGQYATVDGRRKSVTTYDPEAPNVRLDIDFASVEDATDFSRILLCRPLTGNAADQVLQRAGNCTLMHQSHDIGEKEPGDIIHVWKEETDPKGETYEVHDRVSFSDILDLDVSVADQHVRLFFGYMDRLQYHPAWDHPKLPQNVKRTPDGGPDSGSYQGAEFPTSRLELVIPSTDLEVQQLLKCLAGNKLSWQFEAMFLRRKIKISPVSKGLARVLPGSKECLTQVTLWSNDNKLRILM